jgi:hypothetical protein
MLSEDRRALYKPVSQAKTHYKLWYFTRFCARPALFVAQDLGDDEKLRASVLFSSETQLAGVSEEFSSADVAQALAAKVYAKKMEEKERSYHNINWYVIDFGEDPLFPLAQTVSAQATETKIKGINYLLDSDPTYFLFTLKDTLAALPWTSSSPGC